MDFRKKEELRQFYCADEMRELKKLCNPIIVRKKLPQMYYDDLYSDALRVLEESLDTFQEGKSTFSTFLTGNIKRSFYDWTRNSMRGRRCNLQRDKNGKIVRDEGGNPIVISDVSFDAPTDEGINLSETVAANETVEDVVFSDSQGLTTDGRAKEFLNTLGKTQRRILELRMDDYSPGEIRKKLGLSNMEYHYAMEEIRQNKNISILNRRNIPRRKAEAEMEETKVLETMELDTTDGYRMDKYNLLSLLNKKSDGEIDCNYVSQRAPFQWQDIQINKFYTRVLNNQPIPEIIICETVEDGEKVAYLIDGLQRLSYAEWFRENRISIKAKGAEFTKIKYRRYEYDENGNKVLDEKGRAKYEIDTFDVAGKYYKDLPEFLQKRFDDFNVNVTTFFNCTEEMIDYHIRNYNNHVGMTKSQYGITNVSNATSGNIKAISEGHAFFKDYITCSSSNRRKGALEEVVARTIMTLDFLNDWKKESLDTFLFIDENATERHYARLRGLLDRLCTMGCDSVKGLFTATNAHIWFAVFDRFTMLGMEDSRFLEFMQRFQKSMNEYRDNRDADGCSGHFIDADTYEIFMKRNTKDKAIIKNKIDCVYDLLLKYLHMAEHSAADTPVMESGEGGVGNRGDINKKTEQFMSDFLNTDLMYFAAADMSEEDMRSVAVETLKLVNDNTEDALLYADCAGRWLLEIKDNGAACTKNVLPAIVRLVKYFYDLDKTDQEGIAVLEKYLHSGFVGNNVMQNYKRMISCAA